MMERWVLQRYFGRQYLLWFMVFLGSLSGIVFLFEIAELMRRAGSRSDVGFDIILKMGVYKLPETIERILPFVILFSGLFTFWRLTRSQELVVARSVGISAWQFMRPALMVTLTFALINVAIINPVGAVMNARYKVMEMHYLERVPTLELTGAGLWLRQQTGQKHYLLHADHVEMDPLTLSPLMAFIYDENDNYVGRVDAPKAVLQDGAWDVPDAWLNWDQQPAQHLDDWRLPTTLNLAKIQESMAAPDTISFWELPRFIRALKTIGLPQARHQLAFQSLLSQPLLLCSMVFFAAAFALRMNRRGGVTSMIIAGVLLGSFVYTLNNVVNALGINQTLPVVLAAWAIPLVALALSNAALLHMEEVMILNATEDLPGSENPGDPVLRFRSIWISDIHLGTRGCQAERLLDFLRHTESDYLYLVGDIVDGWHLRRRWYWPQAHNDVVQKILRRARHGTKVFYVPGNHDEAARPFCGLHFGGVYVVNEIIHETADGKRMLVLHGDQFDAVVGYAKWLAHLGDIAYDLALYINRVFNTVRRRLGFPYWSLSAYLKHKVKNAVDHISAFETFIAERAKHDGADAILCGHIHHAEIRQIGPVLYLNDGDWVESCTAMVEDFDGKLSILRWTEDRDRLLLPLIHQAIT